MSKKSAKFIPHEPDKDRGSSLDITGRYQSIPRDPAKYFTRPTLAAGAVLWRGDMLQPETIEVALIHRPHYDDWSLPKGKVDPDESLPTTAVREIEEETGFSIRLEKLLGHVTYPVADRTKVVYYWTAETLDGTFKRNDEADELRWLSIPEAKALLSYDVDAEVLTKAEKRFNNPADTRILYVRHARAHDRQSWAGDDNIRPLDKKGRRQAEMLVPMLSAFRPERIYSALPDRCQTTAAPLADELGLPVTVDARFGDDQWNSDPAPARKAFQEVVEQGGTSVIVSQGTIIPEILTWLSHNGQLPLANVEAKKGSTWVLFFRQGELIGADYLASALPVK